LGWCRFTLSLHSYWPLCSVTFCKNKSNNWSKVLITSGTNDAWVIPTSARMLFSQVRVKRQGHRCILDGPKPGLIIGDTGDFVPFVIEEETQFCMFPMYPPPTPLLDMQVYIHRLWAFSILRGQARAHQKRTPLFSTPSCLKSCSNVPLSSERPKLT
jgi:hypothetical protein